MYAPITVNKDSKFFIALCKDSDSPHSFVSLGVENGNKQVLLGAFGKVFGKNSDDCRFFFSDTEGRINNERRFFAEDKNKTPIHSEMTYKAYSISYAQYLEFLKYMKTISLAQKKNSPLMAYCPQEEDKTSPIVTLKWQSVNYLETEKNANASNDDINQHLRIGKSNTCRHTAINFTKRATKLNNLGKGISSFFAFSPPLKTSILGGTLGADGQHIYILPLPPKSFTGVSKSKLAILNKLYTRLDEIILMEQYNRKTSKKFEQIKALYNSITANEKSNLNEVLKEITSWVNDNKDLISTHRKPHWISFKTTTERMFNKILETKPEPTPSPK